MRILLICDDYWHPGQVPAEGIRPLESHGFEFDIITDANDFKPEMLRDYPVVLLSKCDEVSNKDKTSWKTDLVQKAFIRYAEDGGGIVAVHTATVAGKNTGEMDRLIGCKFVYHPNACPVTVAPLKPHPVTEGTDTFCEVDEHYRIEMLTEDADILLASYSPPQGDPDKYEEDPYNNSRAHICPAGYVRTQGKGRICVLTPGHNLPVWQNPNFLRILKNALQWCAAAGAAAE